MIAFLDDMVIERDNDVLFTELDDSIVMMDFNNGDYVALDTIGAVIWRRIATPVSFGALCTELTAEYEVGHDECREQVGSFLERMVERKFAYIRASESGAAITH